MSAIANKLLHELYKLLKFISPTKGLETLALRMERHCENAMVVAKYLLQHPKVEWVNYAGVKFYDKLNMIKRLVNISDAKSLACHPASTTHRQMTKEEQMSAGVTAETLRLCIGIEHIDDIIADLDQAFEDI